MAQVGEQLARARHRLGLSLDELAVRTHLGVDELVAIERHDASRLPPLTHLRRCIRGYAHELGLDGENLDDRYLAALGDQAAFDEFESECGDETVEWPAAPGPPVAPFRFAELAIEDRFARSASWDPAEPLFLFPPVAIRQMRPAAAPPRREGRSATLFVAGSLLLGGAFYTLGLVDVVGGVDNGPRGALAATTLGSTMAPLRGGLPAISPVIPSSEAVASRVTEGRPIDVPVAPSGRLSGPWRLSMTFAAIDAAPPTAEYLIEFQQQGKRVTGTGVLWDSGTRSSAAAARTPVRLWGTIDGDHLTVTVAAAGAATMTSVMDRVEDGSFSGTFWSDGPGGQGAARATPRR